MPPAVGKAIIIITIINMLMDSQLDSFTLVRALLVLHDPTAAAL
jgi:hypothetical protein